MRPQVRQLNDSLSKRLIRSFSINLLFAIEHMDNKEKIDNHLLQEINDAKLEDEAAGLAENTMDSHLLQATVILDIIAELVDILDHNQVR